MILPSKYIKLENSIFFLGAVVLSEKIDNESVSSLWEKLRRSGQIGSFDRFVAAMDFLYLIGAVTFEGGLVKRIK